jgi:hypothetical protein
VLLRLKRSEIATRAAMHPEPEQINVASFLPKHAGYAAAVVAAGLLAGAWMLMRVGDTRPASAQQTVAKTEVNVEQQYVDVTEKQAETFTP